jgi:predicted dienelactone hydrolase
MRKVLVLALSALLVFLAGSAWLALYPGVPPDLGGAPNLDGQSERVRIPVGEDDHVNARLLRGTRPGVVVLLHGYARDHRRMWRYARFLRRDGWTLLLVDFRSSRSAHRKPTTLGFWELADARAVLDWVGLRPEFARHRVGIFAESLGGSVALVAAAGRPDVAALVVDSPFANGAMAIEDGCRYVEHVPVWPCAPLARLLGRLATGHDPGALDAVPALRALGDRPVLLIQAGIEDRFGLREVRLLEEAAGPRTERWRVDDAGHIRAWIAHRDAYERRVRGFFRAHLSAPAGPPARAVASAPRRVRAAAASARAARVAP